MLETGLDAKNTFYILNPRNDLKRTEQIFLEWFERFNYCVLQFFTCSEIHFTAGLKFSCAVQMKIL